MSVKIVSLTIQRLPIFTNCLHSAKVFFSFVFRLGNFIVYFLAFSLLQYGQIILEVSGLWNDCHCYKLSFLQYE